jgi:NAD(P)-dependent dehydrogenase (short-subunit alcohol dehydrogenase family)
VGTFDGKVAFITGGGRGQGRSHAVTLAQRGADVVLYDVPAAMPSISYAPASLDDLKQTQSMVTDLGRKCLVIEGDVRSDAHVQAAVNRAIEDFGHVDIMLANAGVASYFTTVRRTEPDGPAAPRDPGHLQCHRVPGQRRGPVHHRRGARRERRQVGPLDRLSSERSLTQ